MNMNISTVEGRHCSGSGGGGGGGHGLVGESIIHTRPLPTSSHSPSPSHGQGTPIQQVVTRSNVALVRALVHALVLVRALDLVLVFIRPISAISIVIALAPLHHHRHHLPGGQSQIEADCGQYICDVVLEPRHITGA